jgi:NAD(P) transhydrogenase
MGNLISVPGAAAVIGGGVIAVEYATVLAELGVGVSLICQEDQFLPFLEDELRQALKRRMKRNHILFVREPVKEIAVAEDSISVALERLPQVQRLDANGEPLPRRNAPERKLKVDLVLYSGGRDANSEDLGLSSVGANIGKYGRIIVDANYRTTSAKSVYAVGDVIGPPGLASAAQQQVL